MTEMYGVEYPELVEDRDGDMMPFDPDLVGKGKAGQSIADWKNHFCICGHLFMDHHCDGEWEQTHRMPCWAKDCSCYHQVSPGAVIPVFQHHNPQN